MHTWGPENPQICDDVRAPGLGGTQVTGMIEGFF